MKNSNIGSQFSNSFNDVVNAQVARKLAPQFVNVGLRIAERKFIKDWAKISYELEINKEFKTLKKSINELVDAQAARKLTPNFINIGLRIAERKFIKTWATLIA